MIQPDRRSDHFSAARQALAQCHQDRTAAVPEYPVRITLSVLHMGTRYLQMETLTSRGRRLGKLWEIPQSSGDAVISPRALEEINLTAAALALGRPDLQDP